jgi:hypothetical protein
MVWTNNIRDAKVFPAAFISANDCRHRTFSVLISLTDQLESEAACSDFADEYRAASLPEFCIELIGRAGDCAFTTCLFQQPIAVIVALGP